MSGIQIIRGDDFEEIGRDPIVQASLAAMAVTPQFLQFAFAALAVASSSRLSSVVVEPRAEPATASRAGAGSRRAKKARRNAAPAGKPVIIGTSLGMTLTPESDFERAIEAAAVACLEDPDSQFLRPSEARMQGGFYGPELIDWSKMLRRYGYIPASASNHAKERSSITRRFLHIEDRPFTVTVHGVARSVCLRRPKVHHGYQQTSRGRTRKFKILGQFFEICG